MRVLVTGASGFIGRRLVRILSTGGCEVLALTRSPGPIAHCAGTIRLDLLRADEIAEPIADASADMLIHLAWYTKHGAFWSSRQNEKWVPATERLVKAFCAAGGAQVLVAGSCAEYDWSSGKCHEENTPLLPASLYGRTKNEARQRIMAACAGSGTSLAWARIFFPIGPDQSPSRLIPSVLDVLQGVRSPFPLDGAALRDFMHVEDVARALSVVAISGTTGAVNVCTGRPTAIRDVVRILARRLQVSPEPIETLYEERDGDPRILYGDARRLRSIGFRHAMTVEQALDSIVAGC